MKKIHLIIFYATLCFLVACSKPKAKNYACKNYSLDCELEKDRIIILPINFNPTIVDAFNDKINTSYHQWYLISTKLKILVPINITTCVGGNINTGPDYSDNPSPLQIMKDWGRNKVRLDTTDLSLIIPGLTKAVVIISGPNEMVHRENNVTLAIP